MNIMNAGRAALVGGGLAALAGGIALTIANHDTPAASPETNDDLLIGTAVLGGAAAVTLAFHGRGVGAAQAARDGAEIAHSSALRSTGRALGAFTGGTLLAAVGGSLGGTWLLTQTGDG